MDLFSICTFVLMSIVYNFSIYLVAFVLRIIALFNLKIKRFVKGRKETFSRLAKIHANDKVIWLHVASLGEFEQARPIIEQIKNEKNDYKIVVTFFSPSGYEIRKNYNLADVVCYLPLDTKANVRKFIKQVHPDLAIIVKYEFWPNLLNELKLTQTKTILVSGIFRKNQIFFKSYGKFMRDSLHAFDHFFIQNKKSEELLNSIRFKNTTIAGDTRFDRVYEILNQDNTLDFITNFKNGKHTVVAGSTWNEGEELLTNYINNTATDDEKFIIAPHKIDEQKIETLKNKLHKKTILYSEKEGENLSEYQVFIIDTIGILTKIYSYADVAYVGGGFETGLHNILEPATFGVPVIFGGKNHQKFQEAIDLTHLGGCKIIENQNDFSSWLQKLFLDSELKIKTGKINQRYVVEHIGATQKIMTCIKNNL